MKDKRRLIVVMGITMLVMTIMIMGGANVFAEIVGTAFKMIWDDDTATTETVKLRASGTLKSILVNVPAADGCRIVVEDHETGYRHAAATLTTNTKQRVSLSGEASGVLDVKIWLDPSTSGSSVVGQLLIDK